MEMFKRFEYETKGHIQWSSGDMIEGDNWEEFKEKITEDDFYDYYWDLSTKDIANPEVVRIVEGYYGIKGDEVITNVIDVKQITNAINEYGRARLIDMDMSLLKMNFPHMNEATINHLYKILRDCIHCGSYKECWEGENDKN